jgi:hypothetical protein
MEESVHFILSKNFLLVLKDSMGHMAVALTASNPL